MNIEIITIISYNYGNRLQNYALQHYLERRGCHVVTSRLDDPANPLYENHFREWRVVTDPATMQLYRAFDANIKWKPNWNSPLKDDEAIDKYVAGSDQIWNPIFEFGSPREFLRFTKPEKRVAYSASIGIKELPDDKVPDFRSGMLGIPHISMREKAGADIVEKLTGKRPPVTLDPTMLLDAWDWMPIAETSAIKIQEKYIVKYFLGIRNAEYDTKIERYAKEHGCKIIDLIDHKGQGFDGVGPAEFLYLMMHSQANFVDSFHGAVFSILFQKPFLAFYRPVQKEFGDMNSRFDTLFDTFRMKNRLIRTPADFDQINQPLDGKQLEDILQRKRSEAASYLRPALKLS